MTAFQPGNAQKWKTASSLGPESNLRPKSEIKKKSFYAILHLVFEFLFGMIQMLAAFIESLLRNTL